MAKGTNLVIEIGFGPPTAESKNYKNYVNFDFGGLFLGPQLSDPPKMSMALQAWLPW